ncbi:hypothetical protein NEMBOFW57_009487 [Staphylotrichum longicolle]|uniref:SCA7 domain-containing protein n=1 Tax=Staphylotrichum longicolle TaxID=669026 RepID=A0AAD4ESX6_9PEZI|nr:hypothetical protein NEMBOFW57_009487 [Staphylotrichum longicolle]
MARKQRTNKKKDELKPKVAKPKRPIDVERHMNAKRAVPGRSLPYEMLLATYRERNWAKQQKAAIDANAPLEDEDEASQAAVRA